MIFYFIIWNFLYNIINCFRKPLNSFFFKYNKTDLFYNFRYNNLAFFELYFLSIFYNIKKLNSNYFYNIYYFRQKNHPNFFFLHNNSKKTYKIKFNKVIKINNIVKLNNLLNIVNSININSFFITNFYYENKNLNFIFIYSLFYIRNSKNIIFLNLNKFKNFYKFLNLIKFKKVNKIKYNFFKFKKVNLKKNVLKNYSYKLFKKLNKNYFIKNQIVNMSNFFSLKNVRNYNLLYLRKNKIFNKGRYSRNRQLYRTGVYWCLWVNIIFVYGLYFIFYRFSFNFGYLWIGCLILFYSTIFSRILKYNFINVFQILKELVNFTKWIGFLIINISINIRYIFIKLDIINYKKYNLKFLYIFYKLLYKQKKVIFLNNYSYNYKNKYLNIMFYCDVLVNVLTALLK